MKLNIGENIRRRRREADMTQEQLGEELGVSYQAISRWENGTAYPDIEFLPTLAKYFGMTVDELMGYGENERKKRVAELLEELELGNYRKPIDERRVIGIIREMRRDHLFDCGRDFWWAMRSFDRMPGVLPELRITAETVLDKSTDMNLREDVIYYMAMYEDDEHIEDLLQKYSSKRDLSYRNLCFERYSMRGEKDKYEEMLQIKFCYAVMDLTGNLFYTDNTNRVLTAEEHLRVNTFQLGVLNWLTNTAPTKDHPVFGDGDIDEWTADRISLGLDRAGYLASEGDTEGAFAVLEDTVSMLERIMKRLAEGDGKITIKGKCAWVDKAKITLQRVDHEEDDYHGLAMMWEIGGFHDLIGHTGPQGVHFTLTTDRSDKKWFDPIRNDERYRMLVERAKAII